MYGKHILCLFRSLSLTDTHTVCTQVNMLLALLMNSHKRGNNGAVREENELKFHN